MQEDRKERLQRIGRLERENERLRLEGERNNQLERLPQLNIGGQQHENERLQREREIEETEQLATEEAVVERERRLQILKKSIKLFSLKPQDGPFDFFGGQLPEGNAIWVWNSLTAYNRIQRPANLPSLRYSPTDFTHFVNQQQYLKIFDEGHFNAAFKEPTEGDRSCYLSVCPHEGRQVPPLMLVDFACAFDKEQKHFSIECKRPDDAPWCDDVMLSFYDSLSPNQRKGLSNRAVHHFLRQHGASLDEQEQWLLPRKLFAVYSQKRKWEEALDIAMVGTDLLMNQAPKQRDDFARSLQNTGVALQGLQRFGEAADVFSEAAKWSETQKFEYYHLSAASFQAARDFASAEAMHIKALCDHQQHKKAGWSANGAYESYYLRAISQFYHGWIQSERAIDVDPAISTLELVLVALLIVAGVDDRCLDTQSILQRRCQDRMGAGKALKFVAAAGPESFRKKLRGFGKPTVPLQSIVKGKAIGVAPSSLSVEDEFPDSYFCDNRGCGKLAKKQDDGSFIHQCPCKLARYCSEDCMAADEPRHRQGICSGVCTNCGTVSAAPLQHCGCGVAFYCSRECQLGDWKRHKTTCTHHHRAKKEKEELKAAGIDLID